MRILRAIRRIFDALDAAYAVIALLIVVVLVASGRMPHDLELWVYAAGGLFLIVGLGLVLWWGLDATRRQQKENRSL